MQQYIESPSYSEDLAITDRLLRCPMCQIPRVYATSGWVCGASLQHTGILHQDELATQLQDKLRHLKGEIESVRKMRIAALVKQVKTESLKPAKKGKH